MLMLGVFWMKQYKEDTMKELGGEYMGKSLTLYIWGNHTE